MYSIGDAVTVKKPVTAYYSGYAGNPECIIRPGDIGVVAAVNVPSVWWETKQFICVDFHIPGRYQGDPRHGNCVWRIGADPRDLAGVHTLAQLPLPGICGK